MAKANQQGFTLIEIILVVAISGALLLVAFIGQGQLRAQARFDAAVNKIVATINEARNSSTAGVNVIGDGNGQGSCNGAGPGEYVFAGVGWAADATSNVHLDYYKAVPQSSDPNESCIFTTDNVNLPTQVSITSSIDAGAPSAGASELFIRSNDLLNVCPTSTASAVIKTAFRTAACTEGKLTLTIKDTFAPARQGTVEVDKSGLAQRKS